VVTGGDLVINVSVAQPGCSRRPPIRANCPGTGTTTTYWRGAESVRPIPLERQGVTETDMIAAADAYEAQLNG
jgi:hypothetical protein